MLYVLILYRPRHADKFSNRNQLESENESIISKVLGTNRRRFISITGHFREDTITKWQRRWKHEDRRRWTARPIPDIMHWIGRKFGEVNYCVVQLLSGHRHFRKYLHRMGKTVLTKKAKQLWCRIHCFRVCLLAIALLWTDINNWNDHGR